MTCPPRFTELFRFALLQARACLFGAALLAALIGSALLWQPDWPIARYDALFVFALSVQAVLLWLRIETWQEARVIALFHLTGTVMELFKTHMGSWTYPEPGLIRLWDVPLFSGFLYASVGSYIARAIRLHRMIFDPYPPLPLTFALAAAIYGNFFGHHYGPDLRMVLFLATVVLFARTTIHFTVIRRWAMPLPVAAFLASVFLWIAENVGTQTGTWVYHGGLPHDWAPLSKMGSWYLLLYVSFVTVTLVLRAPLRIRETPARPAPRPAGPERSTG